jgi:exopolysaccharide/PEP-CTERM locus tyrosine autokinase
MSFVQKAVDRIKKQASAAKESPALLAKPVHEPTATVKMPDRPGEEAGSALQIEVNPETLRNKGFLAPIAYERRLAEEYRRIKRPIMANAFGSGAAEVPDGSLVMVASALSGEGKTRTCINLALSISEERDRNVVLVDGDVAKPTVSMLFGMADHTGLLDLVDGACSDLADVLVTTTVPGLMILPAGKPRENATELLASSRMRQMVSQLSANHPDRIVLFDSPPLLATTESVVLAGIVGQVAVVVAAGATPKSAVREAVGLLDPDKAINIILNKNRRAGGGGGYGYGYGYGQYGHHGTSDDNDAESV